LTKKQCVPQKQVCISLQACGCTHWANGVATLTRIHCLAGRWLLPSAPRQRPGREV
jgi:hypothetical protein